MSASIFAVCLLLSSASASVPLVLPQLLIGEWKSEQDGTYHFYANGTYYWHAADMGEDGIWRLRGKQQLELVVRKDLRHIIVIDRVVHETLYVRTQDGREVWLKRPGA